MESLKRSEIRKEELEKIYNGQTKNAPNFFSKNNYLIRNGLVAGVLMAGLMILINTFSTETYILNKIAQTLALVVFLTLSINRNKKAQAAGKIFQKGMIVGLIVSAVSALSLVLTNLSLSFVFPSFMTHKFGLDISSTTNLLVANFGTVLETFVMGMIITFIILQLKKRSSSTRAVK